MSLRTYVTTYIHGCYPRAHTYTYTAANEAQQVDFAEGTALSHMAAINKTVEGAEQVFIARTIIE